MLECRIYVGLHDKDYHKQFFETDIYKMALKDICVKYRVPYSLQMLEGGYFHDDGTWVEENTLLITLVGAPKRTVYSIAKDLCVMFHQESVMITTGNVVTFNVRDDSK
ncbi:MAG: hypothetical protein IJT54_05800 [Candidatus Methanomethylophilaceae archaeon]|nr:hypothetical protein [Candidatus Methanomethylophilaceae archaeon]